MDIGKRLRYLREERHLSQGDIERKIGLYRSYVSRVEGGRLLPGLTTLERFAAALDVPLFWLFQPGKGAPLSPSPRITRLAARRAVAESADTRFVLRIQGLIQKMIDPDRDLLLALAGRLAARQSLPRQKASSGKARPKLRVATLRPAPQGTGQAVVH